MATNLELAGKVAKCVDLYAVNLRYANVEAKCDPGSLPEEIDVDLQYRASFERINREGGFSELAVTVEFKFNVKSKIGDEAGDDVLLLDAGYLLNYWVRDCEGIDEGCYKYFSDVNGPYNAWPYWRELVQSVTGRVGLPGFVVPVFRPESVAVTD